MEFIHESLAHPGATTTYQALAPCWAISNLVLKLKHQIRKCQVCQEFRKTTHKYGKIHRNLTTFTPFRDIGTDIYGPVNVSIFEERSEHVKFYLLTITDRCSRCSEVYLIKTLEAKQLLDPFSSWFRKYGVPATVLSVQGTQYMSIEFGDLLGQYNMNHLVATTYNPTGNSSIKILPGYCERLPRLH